ncbi:predicted protein [Coccidioides posadasii str. Silveira]|uniref:Predicted protein n=1 Tax=Coccidioides posadasii (strain RMSCC 757 / Silveira) TaxID=443226 RepID=E9DAS0_COCPS|nr:predicted protein [Coccidioides posadasii str. Silveira]
MVLPSRNGCSIDNSPICQASCCLLLTTTKHAMKDTNTPMKTTTMVTTQNQLLHALQPLSFPFVHPTTACPLPCEQPQPLHSNSNADDDDDDNNNNNNNNNPITSAIARLMASPRPSREPLSCLPLAPAIPVAAAPSLILSLMSCRWDTTTLVPRSSTTSSTP